MTWWKGRIAGVKGACQSDEKMRLAGRSVWSVCHYPPSPLGFGGQPSSHYKDDGEVL